MMDLENLINLYFLTGVVTLSLMYMFNKTGYITKFNLAAIIIFLPVTVFMVVYGSFLMIIVGTIYITGSFIIKLIKTLHKGFMFPGDGIILKKQQDKIWAWIDSIFLYIARKTQVEESEKENKNA